MPSSFIGLLLGVSKPPVAQTSFASLETCICLHSEGKLKQKLSDSCLYCHRLPNIRLLDRLAAEMQK